jgi:hypothetical protein
MKFGKRRWEAKLEAKAAGAAATPSAGSVPESWRVPGDDAAPESSAPPPPAGDEPEPVVEGEAVELPMTEVVPDVELAQDEPEPVVEPEPAAYVPEPEPEPAAYVPEPFVPPAPPAPALSEPLPPPGASWGREPDPAPMPFPVAEEPVLVYRSGPESEAVTPLAETGEVHASGHATGMSPSWPEPVMALAAERPEAVVGAAFAGGFLLAMILRRLGN